LTVLLKFSRAGLFPCSFGSMPGDSDVDSDVSDAAGEDEGEAGEVTDAAATADGEKVSTPEPASDTGKRKADTLADVAGDDEEEEPFREPEEPVSIVTGDHCFDVQFHPREPMVVCSLVTGAVEFHRFDFERGTSEMSRSLPCHKESCRAVRFLPSPKAATGNAGGAAALRLVSTSADKLVKVWDVERGKRFWKGKLAAAGNALCPVNSDCFISGTDEGGISLHDMRQKSVVVKYTENEDFITDLVLKNEQTLAATSGDGTLAIYDLRKNGTKGLIAMSDFQEDEFLSLAIVKGGTKVICGSQTGVLCCFSWGDFGDQNDRIRGHPMSVDTLLKVDETHLLSGSSDGSIRAVSTFDSKTQSGVQGVVADHGKYPVECLSLSSCGEMFASASHGQPSVRIWPMEIARPVFAGKDPSKPAEEVDSDDSDEPAKKKKKKPKKKKRRVIVDEPTRERNDHVRKAGNFFSDL